MIRKFRIGDIYKNDSTGAYDANKNIWDTSDELKISGYNRYDVANEWDFNRPVKDLTKNDEILNSIISKLLETQYSKGVLKGCDISQSSNWATANLTTTEVDDRLTASPKQSIPFIPPISLANTANIYDTDFSVKSVIMDDGILLGNEGGFYVSESDFVSMESVIMKSLRLEPWKQDSVEVSYSSRILPDEDKKYKAVIVRKANGASGDTQEKTGTFYFDSMYETGGLYEQLITDSWDDGVDIESVKSILFAKADNRFILGGTGSNQADEYLWNYIVLNNTKERLEVYCKDTGNPTALEYLTEYDRFDGIDAIEALTDDITVIYSAPVDGNGDFASAIKTNGNQGHKLLGKELTAETGLSINTTYYFYLDIDGKGKNMYSITTAADTTYSAIIDLLNNSSALSGEEMAGVNLSNLSLGASFRLIDGDLMCSSISGGTLSSIEMFYAPTLYRTATTVPTDTQNAGSIHFKIDKTAIDENTNWHYAAEITALETGIFTDGFVTVGNYPTWGNSRTITLTNSNIVDTNKIGGGSPTLTGDFTPNATKFKGFFVIQIVSYTAGNGTYNLYYIDNKVGRIQYGLFDAAFKINVNPVVFNADSIVFNEGSSSNMTLTTPNDTSVGNYWVISVNSNVDALVTGLNNSLSSKGISLLVFDDLLTTTDGTYTLVISHDGVTDNVVLNFPLSPTKATFKTIFNQYITDNVGGDPSLTLSCEIYNDKILIYSTVFNPPVNIQLTNGDGLLTANPTVVSPILFSDLIEFSNNGNEKLVLRSKDGIGSVNNILDLNDNTITLNNTNDTYLVSQLGIAKTPVLSVTDTYTFTDFLTGFIEYTTSNAGTVGTNNWYVTETYNFNVENSVKFYESSNLKNVSGQNEGDVAKESAEDSKWMRWTKFGEDRQFWVET